LQFCCCAGSVVFFGYFIDRRRQRPVFFGYGITGIVGIQRKADFVVHVGPVWVMMLGFGGEGDLGHKAKAWVKLAKVNVAWSWLLCVSHMAWNFADEKIFPQSYINSLPTHVISRTSLL
jgi:hypothetical protein